MKNSTMYTKASTAGKQNQLHPAKSRSFRFGLFLASFFHWQRETRQREKQNKLVHCAPPKYLNTSFLAASTLIYSFEDQRLISIGLVRSPLLDFGCHWRFVGSSEQISIGLVRSPLLDFGCHWRFVGSSEQILLKIRSRSLARGFAPSFLFRFGHCLPWKFENCAQGGANKFQQVAVEPKEEEDETKMVMLQIRFDQRALVCIATVLAFFCSIGFGCLAFTFQISRVSPLTVDRHSRAHYSSHSSYGR